MHNTIRLAAGIITAVVTTAALAEPGASNAALTMISPGDQVDYVTANANTQFCTIGYVYRGPDLHTYAVTAGHCRSSTSGYARDTRTGLPGNFVRTVVEPPRSGGGDYALIDFGRNSLPSAFLYGRHPHHRRSPPAPGRPVGMPHRSVQRRPCGPAGPVQRQRRSMNSMRPHAPRAHCLVPPQSLAPSKCLSNRLPTVRTDLRTAKN